MSAIAESASSRARARSIEVRVTRGRKHREIRRLPRLDGRVQVAELLEDPPDWLWSLPVGDLLAWPFRTTRRDLNEWLAAGRVSPLARVAGRYGNQDRSDLNPTVLTQRQRTVLAACLRGDTNGGGNFS